MYKLLSDEMASKGLACVQCYIDHRSPYSTVVNGSTVNVPSILLSIHTEFCSIYNYSNQ